ncbi:MAG: hypothetical protein C0621_00950 [Desulfuromonas sp.]|nr:MAG: hypothetical protein C0621_00950 [Desulfuromonas sp.]
MKLRYYITGHGLGHVSRSCLILQHLREFCLQVVIEVCTTAPPWFLRQQLPSTVPIRSLSFDLGVIQRDSLDIDADQTLWACQSLLAERTDLLRQERDDLLASGVTLVAADIPAVPLRAAHDAGIPALGIANFTWDWIYAGMVKQHPEFTEIAKVFREDYSCATAMLRLPFHGVFPHPEMVHELPLVARCAETSPDVIRSRLGVDEEVRLGLISFGGFGLDKINLAPLARRKDWLFLSERAIGAGVDNVRQLAVGEFAYPDLVAAADVVITKPGYGIISECIANKTAVLYTSRGDFREEPLLIEGLERYARSLFIENEDLRQGAWFPLLDQLLTLPVPEGSLATNGAKVTAQFLLESLEG